ncbi:MAG TPA: hypothetical protein VHQ21_17325 [Rhodanobacteraceae bacterium]|jgi:hypothetical protein|nr:hypothetical protein [Rhodanobacteraceae bacterium]
MRTQTTITLKVLSVALMLGATAIAGAANPAATPAAKAAKAEAEPAGKTVPYDELHLHIGEQVIVHTTFKTTRIGVLTQVSNTQLTLGIGAAGGSTELTMPKNTVVSVALAAVAPAPQPGTPSAKKN